LIFTLSSSSRADDGSNVRRRRRLARRSTHPRWGTKRGGRGKLVGLLTSGGDGLERTDFGDKARRQPALLRDDGGAPVAERSRGWPTGVRLGVADLLVATDRSSSAPGHRIEGRPTTLRSTLGLAAALRRSRRRRVTSAAAPRVDAPPPSAPRPQPRRPAHTATNDERRKRNGDEREDGTQLGSLRPPNFSGRSEPASGANILSRVGSVPAAPQANSAKTGWLRPGWTYSLNQTHGKGIKNTKQ
jgi:hypothetical protein